MAGIGFHLREIVQKKTFHEWIKLYLYAAIIFAGPWLFSILALIGLSVWSKPDINDVELAIFITSLVYVYAFSLIITGVFQLVVTRYIADALYMDKAEDVAPSFAGVTATVASLQMAIASIFLAFLDLGLYTKLALMGTYVAVSIVWMEMIYLSAAKDYTAIVVAFFLGYLVSVLAAKLLGARYGLEGYMGGFYVGQVVLCFFLLHRVFAEMPTTKSFDFRFLSYFRRYPLLVLSGVFYSTAIWIDKFIYWFGSEGQQVHSLLYADFPYDSAMFFAYASIIPTLAIFLVRIETSFYLRYKSYYEGIEGGDCLGDLLERKHKIVQSLKESSVAVLVYQGLFTITVILLVPVFLGWMGVDSVHTTLYRVACAGAFLHVAVLVVTILLLYFDFQMPVFIVSTIFLVLNGGLTWLNIQLAPDYRGWGYFFACLITLVTGAGMLYNGLQNLEFHTFVKQPITDRQIVVDA